MPISSTETIYAAARRAVISAVSGLKLGEAKASEADVRSVRLTYGRQLADFAAAAATTLKEGGDAYKGLACTPKSFEQKVRTLAELAELRDTLEGALQRVSAAYNDAYVDLGGDVGQVLTTTEAIKVFPGITADKRAQAVEAASRLYKLTAERKADKSAAITAGLSKKQALETEKAETSATIESLKDELEAKSLENKFLKRGALQPEDFSDAGPAAPSSDTLTFKAPAAAARRGARRGRR